MSNRRYKVLFQALVIIYLLLLLIPQTEPSVLKQYNITQARAQGLLLTISIPTVFIWLIALYGVLRFQEYSDSVKDSREARSFSFLSKGLMLLVIGLPVAGISSRLVGQVRYALPQLLPAFTIINNYMILLFSLIAFTLISRGADSLLQTIRVKRYRFSSQFGLAGIIALSSLYTWLLVSSSNDKNGANSFYLPNLVLILTLAIPYLFIWCEGLAAAYNIYLYKKKVKGYIYKSALGSLAFGIASVVTLSISTQILTTLSVKLRGLDLSPLLLIIYTLVFLTAVGYGYIAKGSSQLKRIEEV